MKRGDNGADRRPWLIISQREARAILPILRDYIEGAPLLDDADLQRAERVLTRQLRWLKTGKGPEPTVIQAIIREVRA